MEVGFFPRWLGIFCVFCHRGGSLGFCVRVPLPPLVRTWRDDLPTDKRLPGDRGNPLVVGGRVFSPQLIGL